MSRQRIIKDEINYLVFSEFYLRFDTPGAKRKAFTLLEVAIDCLDKKGFGGVTLAMVAKEAGVSRALIRHYFDDLDDLLMTAIKYIRLRFQKLAVDSIVQVAAPDRKLVAYVETCFLWVDQFRPHANVWLSFMSQCARRPSLRQLNSSAVEAGEERISRLLLDGRAKGIFRFEIEDDAAKAIQLIITGALVTYGSEVLKDPPRFKRIVSDQCLAAAGAGVGA